RNNAIQKRMLMNRMLRGTPAIIGDKLASVGWWRTASSLILKPHDDLESWVTVATLSVPHIACVLRTIASVRIASLKQGRPMVSPSAMSWTRSPLTG
ncbi:MAG: hypothetical protein OEU26_04105, partial [Candidatus Tectomicrobia bacterium]|nr:hypothetical protein [Candidatus Tectomicrobia bacterium]